MEMIRLVQISDTHISEHGQFAESVFDKAINEINKLQPSPDMVVHTGDLTDHGVFADYQFAKKKLEGVDARLFVAPGNHDERNYGQSLFKEIVGPLDHKVSTGKVALFLLNSPEPDRDEGRLGRRRQSFLEQEITGLSREVIKVVVFHHHLVPVPFAGREMNVLEDAGDVLDIVLKHKVDLVLMGHRHVRRSLRIDNTLLVNASTLSCIRTRGRFGHSFNVIDLYRDGTIRVAEHNLTKDLKIQLINRSDSHATV
jgi:3',5'-cyclic AMP phosphodiesterase CpdA